MHIQFYGIYGIENIKIINKHRLELEELDRQLGIDSYKNYERMKKILNEIYSNYEEPWIYADYNTKIYEELLFRKKHVDWFVENKCCWQDKQYRLDRYYKINLDMAPWPAYMVIAVLKRVMYVEGHDQLRIFKMKEMDIIQKEIPSGTEFPNMDSQYDIINEKDDEFKDAYIVVRKSK